MSIVQPSPSMASLILLGAKIILAVLVRSLTAPFRWSQWNGAPVLFKDVFFAGIRTMLQNITIPQSRYINKNTTDTYYDICKQQKLTPKSITLNEVTAHWIGNENADVVILFLHGGGYTQPCTIGHMQYFNRLVKDMNSFSATSRSIAVLFPAYTLAPEATFPTQLNQAAATLSYLLEDCKRAPSSIMITGDSAGGGLVITLLSHMLHPRPNFQVPRVSPQERLRGVFVYIPWISYSTQHRSFSKNASKDALVPTMLRKWAAMYLGVADGEKPVDMIKEGDNYTEPLLAPTSWWEGMHKLIGEVFIWIGEDEVFLDGIIDFGEKFRTGWNAGGGAEEQMTLHVAPEEAHIGPIMDVMLQYQNKSNSQLILEKWLNQRLS